jgi:hypothetical protein
MIRHSHTTPTERGEYFNVYVNVTAHAFNPSHQPLLQIGTFKHIAGVLTDNDSGVILCIQGSVVGSWKDF